MDYIPIDSIKDINIDDISLRDINKRYMDRAGNRFATRFNMRTRRVEIVRIVKGRSEAEVLRRELKTDKTVMKETRESSSMLQSDPGFHNEEPNAGGTQSEPAAAQGDMGHGEDLSYEDDLTMNYSSGVNYSGTSVSEQGEFYENQFMEECSADFEMVKKRFSGLQTFLKSSKYYDSNPADEYNELMREIDIEAKAKADNAVNFYKELISYPRPLSYYMSRMTESQKAAIDGLGNDEAKMETVRRMEIQVSFEEAYRLIVDVANRLKTMLEEAPEERVRALVTAQQQSFTDAKSAVQFLVESCSEKLDKIGLWKRKYVVPS